MPSSLASAAICSVLRVILRVVSVMAVSRCLAILYLSMILPTLSPILSAPTRRPSATAARVLASAVWVAAGDEAFPGVVGVADLGEVLLVEQRQLQRLPVDGQLRDRGCPERGQPA